MQVDRETIRAVIEFMKRVERTAGRVPDVHEIAASLSIPESHVMAILDRLDSDEQTEGTAAFQNSLRGATNWKSAQLGLTEEQWANVQQVRRETGEPISLILHRLGFASSHHIKNALELQFGVNFVDLKSIEPQPALVRLIRAQMQCRYKMVPIAQQGKRVHIAMVNPNDLQALEAASQELVGLEVKQMVCTLEDFLDFIRRSETHFTD